ILIRLSASAGNRVGADQILKDFPGLATARIGLLRTPADLVQFWRVDAAQPDALAVQAQAVAIPNYWNTFEIKACNVVQPQDRMAKQQDDCHHHGPVANPA